MNPAGFQQGGMVLPPRRDSRDVKLSSFTRPRSEQRTFDTGFATPVPAGRGGFLAWLEGPSVQLLSAVFRNSQPWSEDLTVKSEGHEKSPS